MSYLQQLQQNNTDLQDLVEKTESLPIKDVSTFAKILGRTTTSLTAKDFKGITEIGDYAFYSWPNFKTVELSDSVKQIGKSAFVGVLESIDLAKVEKIGESAFQGSQLKTLHIPNTVASLGKNCFYYSKNLESVIFEEGNTKLTSLPNSCFGSCTKLKNLILPEKLTQIGIAALISTGLETIVLPKNVYSINSQALEGNKSLHTIIMKPTSPPSLSSGALANCTALTKIIVPVDCKAKYDAATNWSAFADIIVEEDV